MNNQYEIVIGLEVHAQLATKTKIFCRDSVQFGSLPNSQVSTISLAHPGTLPKLNRQCIEQAVKMGLAFGSHITRKNIFARKNYFYPDLPKGYQITQDNEPICIGGSISIQLKNKTVKTISLHHIHLEEDAGKSLHLENEDATLLDFNRAGTGLIEIVTNPELRSSEEASLLMQEIRRLVRYLAICDGNMEEGSLRCDANVSVRLKGETRLGTRVEIKNLNSFRFIQKAIDYEAERQIQCLETGQKIIQETRTFDSQTGQTYGMRTKENLNDYRYFPEPDLTPIVITDEWLDEIRQQMPALPQELFVKFTTQYQLSEYDASLLIDTKEMADYFEALSQQNKLYKLNANWLNGVIKFYLNEHHLSIQAFPLSPTRLAELIRLVAEHKVSHTIATQQLLPILIQEKNLSALEIATQNEWLLGEQTFDVTKIIQEVLVKNSDKVQQYRKGKKGLQGFFMGEVMKQTQGKIDPKELTKQIINLLENP